MSALPQFTAATWERAGHHTVTVRQVDQENGDVWHRAECEDCDFGCTYDVQGYAWKRAAEHHAYTMEEVPA